MLAVDLHRVDPMPLQHLYAHRLIVHEGARAAVGNLDPTQNQVTVDVDVGLGCDEARRMIDRAVEDSGDLALQLPVSDEAAIAAATESKRERIEQDGFTGSGLAREDS